MVDFKSIDERASLAGTNRLELLLFRLKNPRDTDRTALYAINVFKVRELMVGPPLVRLPGSHPCMVGMANIRGTAVPVIDLERYCNFPKSDTPSNILVVTEFNSNTQGFLVDGVENIIQLAWSEIREPPDMLSQDHNNMLTAMSAMEDGRMLLVIDVERIISEVLGNPVTIQTTVSTVTDEQRLVFFADDSAVARAQIGKILDRMCLPHRSAANGEEAFAMLSAMADEAEREGRPLSESLLAVVTDIEMPRMDGYVLTGKIKADSRFDGIPVMMHSSLSSSENERLGMHVGADAYIAKLKPQEFSALLVKLLGDKVLGSAIRELPPAA